VKVDWCRALEGTRRALRLSHWARRHLVVLAMVVCVEPKLCLVAERGKP